MQPDAEPLTWADQTKVAGALLSYLRRFLHQCESAPQSQPTRGIVRNTTHAGCGCPQTNAM